MTRSLFLAPLVVIAAFASGCGPRDNRLPCFPVGGKILVDGNPVAGITVTFHAVDPKNVTPNKPSAITAQDGTYNLSTYDMIDGAPAGEYAVTLTWIQSGEEGGKADQFRGAHANPATTKFKTTVSDQPNNTFNMAVRFQE